MDKELSKKTTTMDKELSEEITRVDKRMTELEYKICIRPECQRHGNDYFEDFCSSCIDSATAYRECKLSINRCIIDKEIILCIINLQPFLIDLFPKVISDIITRYLI